MAQQTPSEKGRLGVSGRGGDGLPQLGGQGLMEWF